jgi:hypothetical protein
VLTSFKEKLEFGELGESLISRWARGARGASVLPVYEKEIDNGKGPRFFLPNDEQIIAPDLLIVGQSMIRTEAKHKSVFSWHRKTDCWVTGIDLRHYEHYLRLQEQCSIPIYLTFLHSDDHTAERDEPWPCPTGLFAAELSFLQKKENHRSANWGNGGMVYWAYETLTRWASREEVYSYSPHRQMSSLLPTSVFGNNDELIQLAVDLGGVVAR